MIKQSQALIARHLKGLIYSQCRVEGVPVTFPQTAAILDGGVIEGLSLHDVWVIVNLKRAWGLVYDTLDEPSSFALLCQLHKYVGDEIITGAGFIRRTPVTLAGISYKPKDLIIEADVKEALENIKGNGAVDRAVLSYLYLVREQLFLDGNKRVALLFANHISLSAGKGIITIPTDGAGLNKFWRLLTDYYETGNRREMKRFLKECVIIN